MIELEKHDDLWVAKINRPEKANSVTQKMLVSLADIAEEAANSAGCLIITAQGGVFSAGADLDEAREGLAIDPIWEKLSSTIAQAPILTIAALNGTLAGGAFGMALACDIRICVSRATFFYPVMKRGYLPQPSDPKRLTQLIGPARAKYLLLAGEKISSQTAYDWGLVDEITQDDMLIERAFALAQPVREQSRAHVRAMKAMFETN